MASVGAVIDSQYKSGGRKITSTRSGSSRICGKPGMKPSIRPPQTKTIGYETLTRLARATSGTIVTNSAIRIPMTEFAILSVKSRSSRSVLLARVAGGLALRAALDVAKQESHRARRCRYLHDAFALRHRRQSQAPEQVALRRKTPLGGTCAR